ncbi:Plant protein 1589 of unknown function [Striga hermonthica]|uniref:Angiotensin-converting enzyme 2 n=1 Tax=Striga hermonthica TaxID=68872 RepID=A0A9N7RNB4_STRHE|nr:Plant protein 1589 of unknown function [Striga hermonthica]
MEDMKKDQESTQDVKPNNNNIVPHDSLNVQPNIASETPVQDSGSVSNSSNNNRKVSREDIELVQNLIERCLQLYMNRDEVVKTLLNRARIDPAFTTLVWQKLEEENAEFFRAYYIRLKLNKQIILFNHLLDHQYRVMKYPMPVNNNNLPIGYPVAQQPQIPMPTHINAMAYSHIVDGFPAPSNFLPSQMDSGNGIAIETSTAADVSPVMPPNGTISDMPVSPSSVASSGHLPFIAPEISGIGVENSALDTTFTSDVASSVGLQLTTDNGTGNIPRDSLRSFDDIPWNFVPLNFCLSDLTADLSYLGDLGALGNYPGSPFLPSDSDILLDSPEQEDIVEEFFIDSDSVPEQCPPLDEEKSSP